MHVHIEKVLPHEQFIKQLSSHHILNMAASPPHQKLVKYFFYSQEASSKYLFVDSLIFSSEL